MKKISMNKAKKIYDEIKECKIFGDFIRIYIHNDEVKVGYSNELGKSEFLKSYEPKFLVMNEYKISELLEDYWKKDAVKIIQEWVNESIDEYLILKRDSYKFKNR